MAYGGARLPDDLYDRMQALAVRATGERIVFYTGWGCTETSPTSTGTYWDTERVGLIGLPFPGVELKLVPCGSKYELRLRGINVTPGYFGQPDLTTKMFDEEGFYCIGDAGRLVDPQDPGKGIAFDGRVAEDFKLTTGTWVSVGTVRLRAVSAMSPYVADAVVTGHDRNDIGLLLFLSPQGRQAPREDVRQRVLAALREMGSGHAGSSQCPVRALLLEDMPAMEAGEVTDKGYINQRAVLNRRAGDVAALYANAPDPRVIAL